ncbi:fatty acid synthase subunit beta [Coleophoma cylindrospora]|uniref:Fatty acid synthase subunit beta n=1 Tax=Coleophoma cylindrospora TaxID=1849047 RepID=A0A3D8QA63_9HELO|nr:fatty acid synthase subunit beta [Coleophoma cylindrospora]
MRANFLTESGDSVTTYSEQSLSLKYHDFEHSLTLPAHLLEYRSRSVRRFLASISSPEVGLEKEGPCSDAGIFTQYLEFLCVETQSGTTSLIQRSYLESVILEYEKRFLQDDIHAFAVALPDSDYFKLSSIKSYYHLKAVTNMPVRTSTPALLNAASNNEATIYTLFGGQGNNEDYFDELREVYHLYPSFVEELIASSSEQLMALSQKVSTGNLYSAGFDVLSWLRDPEGAPNSDYLISCPISFPLIGLTQLANYYSMCKALGKSPGEILENVTGTTGHSQGIVVAAAIASTDSWSAFTEAAKIALEILFWIGYRSQQYYPQSSLDLSTIQKSVQDGEGNPTPMLNVSGLPCILLQQHVDSVNYYLPEDSKIFVALRNDDQNTVLAGPAQSLCGLSRKLKAIKCPPGSDQTRIPFSQRKPHFHIKFLPITAPFHSVHLAKVSEIVAKDLKHLKVSSRDLRIPVFATDSGVDMRELPEDTDIIPLLVRMIVEVPVNWRQTTKFPGATHLLDFGPGGTSGVGNITHRTKDGTGVRVVLATVLLGSNAEVGYKSEIYGKAKDLLTYGPNWLKLYGPTIGRTFAGTKFLDTKMWRVLGVPPVMVAGMTPTTTRWNFVAATMNAGYHIELACGGFPNTEKMTDAIYNIQQAVPPGRGITVNLIYASPRSMQWQLPLIRRLISEGVPIYGLTIGAGVPSLEVSNEYIRELGLKHIAFKPGSFDGIQSVLKIAEANPDFPVILQWTGGRGGGHHSYEDFHHSILRAYSAIRRHSNVILVAGSGFGGAYDTQPYISGSWSLKLGHPAMPFDGCLLGSRVMTAREAQTADAAKKAIAEAEGVENQHWEKTYQGVAGGVITVRSEMGEPIHKLATRGVLFWAEMDQKIFSLEKSKRMAELAEPKQRAYIIKRLNDDFQKVWFGQSKGNAVDLEDMTYAEVLCRLIELLYIKSAARWIDDSYKKLVLDFVRRLEERFMHSKDTESATSVLRDETDLLDPVVVTRNILDAYPNSQKQVLQGEDVQYFLYICQRPGQKPVTFVPALDENFEVWFKKDSIWQSEDLEAIVDQDVGRCCILQGPVAVKHTKVINEPIKEILDNIYNTQIELISKELSEINSEKELPEITLLDSSPIERAGTTPMDAKGLNILGGKEEIQYHLSSSTGTDLPGPDDWFKLLGGSCNTWRHAIFTSENVIQDRKASSNPIRRLFEPVGGILVNIANPDVPNKTVITLFGTDITIPLVDLKSGIGNEVLVNIYAYDTADGRPATLNLKYNFHLGNRVASLHEVMEDRNQRIKAFYYQLWFGSKDLPSETLSLAQCRSSKKTISSHIVKQFVNAAAVTGEEYLDRPGKIQHLPLDLAIVTCWKELVGPLFCIDGDLTMLVHLSNQFKMLPGTETLQAGAEVESTAYVSAIVNEESGKMVEVIATISHKEMPVMEVTSKFLYRGSFPDYGDNFQDKIETPIALAIHSRKDLVVLQSKSWFHLQAFAEDSSKDLIGRTLIFNLHSKVRFRDRDTYSTTETTGQVFAQISIGDPVQIGTVNYQSEAAQGNPVLKYLQRHGLPLNQPVALTNPIQIKADTPFRLHIPAANIAYSKASGDYNPIHTSRIFSKLANLPGTITHGMYSSSAVRNLVERVICANKVGSMRSFRASFVGMVLPNMEIEVHLHHVGMIEGCKIIEVDARDLKTGQTVLLGEAHVDLRNTTYLFTGQGSQEKNMGMDLYAQSPVARAVWDTADAFFLDNYGFSILDIVKNNPKELTVFFGGVRGQTIRQNYLDMTYDIFAADGSPISKRIFQEVTEHSSSYTFSSPNGLLSATQFTQPALTIMEKASFDDMQSKGLVSKKIVFAGHSLGEYSALAAVAHIMPLERLLSVVFYRGLTMQAGVQRDEAGRSDFSMMAIDPSRISKNFTEIALKNMVHAIATETGLLLEIVNFNVESAQYVCAGDLRALDCLTKLANLIKAQKFDMVHSMRSIHGQTRFKELLQECLQQDGTKIRSLSLKRGTATIPLNGIDVPFHSSFLLPNLNPFREVLLRNIDQAAIDPTTLIGKYIPNVTAEPFSISREYFEKAYDITNSPIIREILDSWESEKCSPPRTPGSPRSLGTPSTPSTEWEVVE